MRNEANAPRVIAAGADGRGRRRSRGWTAGTNEANLSTWTETGAGGPKTPTAAALGLIVSNEPNLPRPGRKRPCLPGPQALPTLGSSAPNEANLPRTSRKLCCRWGQVYQTKPISRRRHGRAETCETKPIPAQTAGDRVQRASATGGTDRAKRSQLALHRPEETLAARAGGPAASGDNRAKQSQSRGGTGSCQVLCSKRAAGFAAAAGDVRKQSQSTRGPRHTVTANELCSKKVAASLDFCSHRRARAKTKPIGPVPYRPS